VTLYEDTLRVYQVISQEDIPAHLRRVLVHRARSLLWVHPVDTTVILEPLAPRRTYPDMATAFRLVPTG
jgi:hypothetical protein